MKLNLLVLLLVLLTASCRKDLSNIQPETKPTTERPAPNYFKLPEGAQPVTIQFDNGKSLSAHMVDTLYYVEGDMVFTKTQIEKLKLLHSGNQRTFITPFANHWWGGWIPFVISTNFSTNDRNTILAAIAGWQNSTTLNFVERTPQNAGSITDYVEFRPATGNSSSVGRIGGRQFINLFVDPTFGVDPSSAAHELGHAIGLFHEQSRADRDNFITVNWGNIRPAVQHNFQTYTVLGRPGGEIGTFDFNSIMLYPSFIFDTDFVFDTWVPTMTRLDGTTWGNNWNISGGDVETVNFVYGPPFARIEYVRVADNSWWTWAIDYEYYEDDAYVRLYADEQCTIPFTTPVAKTGSVMYKEDLNGSTWSGPVNFTVPANSNEVLLQQNMNTRMYYAEYGTAVNWEYRWFERNSAFFRN